MTIKNKLHKLKLNVILKMKVINIKNLSLPNYFVITYKLEIIYIYCICMV